jgi:HEAT repeats
VSGAVATLSLDLGRRGELAVARAVDDLRREGCAAAREEVLGLARHPSPHVLAAVLRYAAALAPEAAREVLARALWHPHYAVRAEAVRGLEALGSAEALRPVRRLLEDGHPAVRGAADRALSRAALEGHRTPEAAARGDIPSAHARALRVARSGDHAVVLLGLGEGPATWARQVVCRRRPAGWVAGPGASAPGWTPTERGLGVATMWGRLPGPARGAVVGWRGREHVVEARDGHFLFAAWDVSEAAAGARPAVLRALVPAPAREVPRS